MLKQNFKRTSRNQSKKIQKYNSACIKVVIAEKEDCYHEDQIAV